MKKIKFTLIVVAVFLFNLINFTSQLQTAMEMRAFQNEIIKGFQEFAGEISRDESKYRL